MKTKKNTLRSRREDSIDKQSHIETSPSDRRLQSEDNDPVFEKALDILRSDMPRNESEIGIQPPTAEERVIAKPQLKVEPQALPARMLNEFVYCPRLFYYEHVEGVFRDNADTVRGSLIHKNVDAGKGELPAADGSESTDKETIHSRSVMLGSERLNVIAKMDLIEARVGPSSGQTGDLFAKLEVKPVDYKAGAPREGEEGNELWDTDQMQLGVQILLLRENGYVCREGVIYYRATKQRVRFEFTSEREQWVRVQIEAARQCTEGPIPPPLDGSPKCVRCSLAPVCLPDETRLLIVEQETQQAAEATKESTTNPVPGEVRRLIAARDEKRAVYLNTPGLHIGRKSETLQIKEERKLIDDVRLSAINHVALFGNIQISTQAVQALCYAGIPITYFSSGGWFYGLTRGHDQKNVFLRIEQFRQTNEPQTCLALARRFVEGKIRNHRTLLRRNHVEPPAPVLARLKQAARDALRTDNLASLLGVEGAAAAVYFEHFAGMVKAQDSDIPNGDTTSTTEMFTFDFKKRNRRPPTDPVNALLSLAYSILAKDCVIAAYAVGFDPYVGFFHKPRFGRPALALDLMEEFRPLIAESAVLTAINNRTVVPEDFVRAGDAVNLSPGGRKKFFQAYEQRMNHLLTHPVFNYKISYRRALELQARLLARVIEGEIPRYIPLITR